MLMYFAFGPVYWICWGRVLWLQKFAWAPWGEDWSGEIEFSLVDSFVTSWLCTQLHFQASLSPAWSDVGYALPKQWRLTGEMEIFKQQKIKIMRIQMFETKGSDLSDWT